MKKNRKSLLITAILFFFLCSCAVLTTDVKSEEENLKKRITTFMKAKMDGNSNDLYSYYDSSFKKAINEDEFIKISRKLKYKSYSIESIEILPSMNEAKVKVVYDISFQGYEFKGADKIQKWIKEKGQWFLKEKSPKSRSKTTLFDSGDKKTE